MQHEHILKYQGKNLELGKDWIDGGGTIHIAIGSYIATSWDPDEERDLSINERIYDECACANSHYKPLIINLAHPLNTKFNGLFRNCVYGLDDDIAVKVRQFEFEGEVYKVGDVISHNPKRSYVEIIQSKKHGLNEGLIGKNVEEVFVISSDKVFYQWEDCHLLSFDENYKYEVKGNLLDEYLQGGSELAKMCGFND